MTGKSAEDWLGLQGRTALVSGGGSGIGQGCALALARVGVDVWILGRSDVTLQSTVDLAEAEGLTIRPITGDVASAESVQSVADRVGSVDILVNAAGFSRAGSLLDLDPADWQSVLDVNLTGCLTLTRAFAPGMAGRGSGALVHVSSISAGHPQPNSGAYSASKAAVSMMSQQLAYELGPLGIRSNTVSPGMVRTPMTEAYYLAAGVAERRDAAVPLRRVARADDIADVVVFLASDRARYVTGSDIVVDGGFTTTLMGTIPRPGFDR